MNLMRVLTAYPPPELDLISYVNKSGGLGSHAIDVRELPVRSTA
jgi:hypothetical protein